MTRLQFEEMPAPLGLRDIRTFGQLIGLWADLESVLELVLHHPALTNNLPQRMQQLQRWLHELVKHDADAALYLMFQQAGQTTVGYSTSHALVCATFCDILASHLQLPAEEKSSLIHAALTMNIGMTQLQDQLALQTRGLDAGQKEQVLLHPIEGMCMLERFGVTNALWLNIVKNHHAVRPSRTPLKEQVPEEKLSRILAAIDRYTAVISPRRTRLALPLQDSLRILLEDPSGNFAEIGCHLENCMGHYPPGTYVQLNTDEIAVVLRHSSDPLRPLVAKILTERGHAIRSPETEHLLHSKCSIKEAVAPGRISHKLNHLTMLRLGAQSAQYSDGLMHLVRLPGTP